MVTNHSTDRALIVAVEKALDALLNVPVVGDAYDQQHADTHMGAYLELKDALAKNQASLRGVDGQDKNEPLTNSQLSLESPTALDALRKAEAVLSQLQDHPNRALDIIRQGYFGHALIRTRSVLRNAGD